MHEHLVGYLRDNRDQIIENWLTGANIPAADATDANPRTGSVPFNFFTEAFDTVLKTIATGQAPTTLKQSIHLDDFIGISCTCCSRSPCGRTDRTGRVCIELHDAGLDAFMSVLTADWDAGHEFNALDRENCSDIINHALSGLIANEIDHCRYKNFRADCPFVFSNQADTPDSLPPESIT